MNLNEIEKKCFIMALFIRDDAERFLLGSGAYEFKQKQLHFAANAMSNDVVEVQGNDGYMLAGQVRRPTTQTFDGYIGDASVNKSQIEGYRRAFLAFFTKNHFYTVVYVFSDGSAIQRRRGFLVDAPEVKELWQLFPEYHVGFNFEDVNYYRYSENSEGEETYGKSADIGLSTEISGGLIWEDLGIGSETGEGTDFSISGTIGNEVVEEIKLEGDTEQKTMTGKNLLSNISYGLNNGLTPVSNSDGSITITGKATSTYANITTRPTITGLPAGTYTFSLQENAPFRLNLAGTYSGESRATLGYIPAGSKKITITTTKTLVELDLWATVSNGADIDATIYPQFESGSTATEFEAYCGGTASPNLDYPQEVQVVSGEQTISISDGRGNSQTYTVDLGSIELCKIGTYQDYIYKSGDDWYIHKEIKKRNLTDYSSLAWWKSGSTVKINWSILGDSDFIKPANKDTIGYMVSDHFTTTTANNLYNGVISVGCAIGDDGLYFSNNSWDANTFKTYITNNTVYIYNPLETATDTQITDATLVSQLDDLAAATGYDGITIFESTGNLSAIVYAQLKAYTGGGVEWDNYGAEWEEGGGGHTVIQVESIEDVYPVWTITGPAYNPTLENLTTGVSIEYSDNVAVGQTLVIDMLNQTAKLNGTSVIENVSGEWLRFVPGNNTVFYTAANSSAPDSTIEWQEIVG